MPDNSIDAVLKNFFPPSASPDWRKMASKEINGKDPSEILAWNGKDELLFLPYYDAQEVAKLNTLHSVRTPASDSGVYDAGRWMNLPEVNAADEIKANEIALGHLSSGADGIIFYIPKGEHTDLHALMQNVEWPHCFVAFRIHDESFSLGLSEFIRNHYDPASVTGALFWESIPKKINLEFFLQSCDSVKTLGIAIPSSTPAAEISEALVRGITLWETYSTGFDAASVLRSIAFSLCVDQNTFETVAKLKALRMLWTQIARAYGIDDYKASDVHIHTRSVMVDDQQYAPHENMLKGSFSAIAAVVGGCDSLTVQSLESPVTARWARNVSSILREESFLRRVDDPIAGSYALDAITNDIARKAWEILQRQMLKVS